MFDELPFRASMVSLAVAFQLVRWPTRHLTGGKATWQAMRTNPLDGIVLSTCTVLWIASVVLYAGFHHRLDHWQLEVPDFVRWIGVASGIAAVALTRWADVALGKNLSIIVQLKQDQTLVTAGPYHWIRHPIYSATILFALMLIVTSCNLLVAICAVTAASLLLGTRIFTEERLLTERFGEQYRRYMRTTGRLLPRLRRPAPSPEPRAPHFLHRDSRNRTSQGGDTALDNDQAS